MVLPGPISIDLSPLVIAAIGGVQITLIGIVFCGSRDCRFGFKFGLRRILVFLIASATLWTFGGYLLGGRPELPWSFL
ncbi:hypothetical protein MFFC18_21570 [Mariniblastus fucicola]|uniref:Uncharacterized protein n=1 Tax=Mariniblastus fucicola TaxID=980251 RepID=A0A5B9PHE0_9BACT|nr:hypothetical protein MFFC18_21570 [Mariniblastus fucicola]